MKKRVAITSNEQDIGSAAQKRQQERQRRQPYEASPLLAQRSKRPSKGSKVQKKERTGLYLVIGALFIVIVFIASISVYNHVYLSGSATSRFKRAAADPTVVQMLTGVSQSTWEAVGTGGVKNPFTTNQGQPLLQGSHGLPQFFYVGAEYCPYCAAERWSIINALSRFGAFSNLSQLQSVEQNIPTFSFYKSSYSSPYVDFASVEVNGNALDTSGQTYVGLETMTPQQQQTFTKYNSAQDFPFVDIGNQYTTVGASYDQTLLLDNASNPRSWQDIASSLANPKTPLSQAILGTANYLTAAICHVTNQQPGNVCHSSVIQQIEHTLNKTSKTSSSEPTRLFALAPPAFMAEQRHVHG